MKEQVITPRAGRSQTGGRGRSGDIVQRPARRGRGAASSSQSRAPGLQKVLVYAPGIAKVVLAVIAGLLIFAGYRAAASAAFFQLRAVDVTGTSRASSDEIRNAVRRAVIPNGVWRTDLDALSRELERLPWVRRAVVSRVLPDGLRVRVQEREPRAVVRTSQGRLVWVDDDAVALGQLQPTDRMPPFFVRGWDEEAGQEARAGNRERVAKYLEMLRDWERLGLVERVSEVNLIDVSDVRVQLAGNDSQIEVRVGRENFGMRLQKALQKLDESRSTPVGPFITYIDASRWMKSGDNIVIGRSGSAPNLTAGATVSNPDDAAEAVTASKPPARAAENDRAADRERKRDQAEARSSRNDERRREAEKKKKDQDKKERAADDDAKRQSRPRRVS